VKAIAELLERGSLTLAIAESCTGGLISKRITDFPGSSTFFRGGVIAYADQVKTQLLGVDERVLAESGAVSETVAIQMARGVADRLNSDIGVGITGIAGPRGGTFEKPVGTVSFAVTAGARVAVLPCCHDLDTGETGRLTGWVDGPLAVDIVRATALTQQGYRIWTQAIPGDITVKNRLLLGAPRLSSRADV
ncbi:MAG TPA: nicotinamide-nucleotide amidohydrolase family protein, partial [Acidobacteria bacterium]|nr:nicotinamide-nucleotide amidohydrolase family protein [Acidobacteriota bacterium]